MNIQILKLFLATLLLLPTAFAQSSVRQVGIVDIAGQPGFDQMIFAKGMLLMSHPEANTVDIFDPVKRRIVGQVKQLSDPRGLALSDDGELVFIANSAARNIVVIGTQDWQVKETISVDGSPQRLLWVGRWNRLLATVPELSAVASIDLAHRAQAGQVSLRGRPEYMAWDESRGQVYITVQDTRTIAAIDSALNLVRVFAVPGSMPTGITYDPQSDHLYVSVRGAVVALDAVNGKESSRAAAPMGIDQLWLDSESRMLLAYSTGKLVLMRAGSTLGKPREVKLELAGHTVAFDSSRSTVYVPGGREGRSKIAILKADLDGLQDRPQEARK